MDPNVRQNIKNEKFRQQFNREIKSLRKIRKSLFNEPKIDPKFKRGECKECGKPLFQSGQEYCNTVCFDIYHLKKKYCKKVKE